MTRSKYDRIRLPERLLRGVYATRIKFAFDLKQAGGLLRDSFRSLLEVLEEDAALLGSPYRVISFFHMHDIYNLLQQCCFWTSPRGRQDVLVHVLSKALPQRCQTRVFVKVVLKLMDKHERCRTLLYQCLACSLLGNYEHVQSALQGSEQRRAIYEMMNSNQVQGHPFEAIFKHTGEIMIFCLREYMIVTIEDDPIFAAHVNQLFDWHTFKTATFAFMDQVRRCVRIGTNGSVTINRALKDVARRACKTVLAIAYQRRRDPFIRIAHTGVPRQKGALVHPDAAEETDDDSDQDLNSDSDEDETMAAPDPVDMLYGANDTRVVMALANSIEQETAVAHSRKRRVVDQSAPVPPLHMRFMYDWLSRLDVTQMQPEMHLYPYLQAWNMHPEAIQHIRRLQHRYDYLRAGKNETQRVMACVSEAFPYSAALFKTICSVWRRHAAVQCYDLPAFYLERQLAAIRERFALPPEAPVPVDCLFFWYCRVCRGVYSLVNSFNRVYKRSYQYGYRDMLVDYMTGTVYCKRKHVSGSAACETAPLVQLFIAGRVIWFRQKALMLCPQPECGMIMVLDPLRCAYNEYGYACSVCTDKLIAAQRKALTKDKPTVGLPELACELCQKRLKPAVAFLYPHDIVLCQKHHHPLLARMFTGSHPPTRSQIIEAMHDFNKKQARSLYRSRRR